MASYSTLALPGSSSQRFSDGRKFVWKTCTLMIPWRTVMTTVLTLIDQWSGSGERQLPVFRYSRLAARSSTWSTLNAWKGYITARDDPLYTHILTVVFICPYYDHLDNPSRNAKGLLSVRCWVTWLKQTCSMLFPILKVLLACFLIISGWRLEFLQPLKDCKVTSGDRATFSCVLSEAVPVHEVAWYHNDVDIQADENWEIQADGNSYKLILKNAQLHHSGEVTFAARDAIVSAKLSVVGKVWQVKFPVPLTRMSPFSISCSLSVFSPAHKSCSGTHSRMPVNICAWIVKTI